MHLTGVRITIGLVLAPVWSVVAYWGMPFVFYPAPALGWVYASLVFALGLGLAGLLVGGRDSLVPLGVAAVLSLSLGVVCWSHMEPDLGRVRAVADDIRVPDDWRLGGEHGNESALFEGGATSVTRTYRTGAATPTAATADLVATMADQGWTLRESSGPTGDRTVVLVSGGWQARVTRGFTGSGVILVAERVS